MLTYYNQIIKSQGQRIILKVERKNQLITQKEPSIKLTAHFSSETTAANRQCNHNFKATKGKHKEMEEGREGRMERGRERGEGSKLSPQNCISSKTISHK